MLPPQAGLIFSEVDLPETEFGGWIWSFHERPNSITSLSVGWQLLCFDLRPFQRFAPSSDQTAKTVRSPRRLSNISMNRGVDKAGSSSMDRAVLLVETEPSTFDRSKFNPRECCGTVIRSAVTNLNGGS